MRTRNAVIGSSLLAMAMAVVGIGSALADTPQPEVLPTVSKELAAKAHLSLAATQTKDRSRYLGKAAADDAALKQFPIAKVRESDLLAVDEGPVGAGVHGDAWVVSLAFPGGYNPIPQPQGETHIKYNYFIVVLDPKTGELLFAESQ